ncbi:MAG: lipopolysaccharide heptosyltransferase II [Halioglobus sp.]
MSVSSCKSPAALSFRHDPESILIVLPTWVGDVVMATPVLQAIFERYPQAQIHLLTQRHLLPLLEGSPWSRHCHVWPPRNKSAEAKQAQKTLIKDLRNEQFDLAIMLPNSLRSAWLCWRSGAKRRLGFNRDGRRILLTDALAVPNKIAGGYEPMPMVDYYGQLAMALGCEHPGDQLTLYTTPDCDESVNERLLSCGVDPQKPLVVISPGANFGASKCWAPERFAAVADQLIEQHGVAIAMSPGPGEEPLAEAIQQAMKQPSALLTNPCLTLGELKSLIERSVLLLGNDTGPRHFARAFNTSRVTVFGPTERRWTDTSHGGETIIQIDVPCGPCHKKVCPLQHHDCMNLVTVKMVKEACDSELLAQGVGRTA